VAIKAFNF